MMLNKRLIAAVGESKKYIAANVVLQWLALVANIAMMGAIAALLQGLYAGEGTEQYIDPHRCGGSCCAGGALWVQRCQCPYELSFLQNGQADPAGEDLSKAFAAGCFV